MTNLARRLPLKVGLDVDGVFADFNGHPDSHGFSRLLVETSGRDLFPRPWGGPVTWSWWRPLGYHTREADVAWRAVEQRTGAKGFWAGLRPLAGAQGTLAVVRQLREHGYMEPYFLTTRPGETALQQTVGWLEDHGVPNAQVVICPNADAKGTMAKGLGLALVVDDHCENLLAVKMHSTARMVLYDRPWSPEHRDRVLALGALLVRDHVHLTDKLKEWSGV